MNTLAHFIDPEILYKLDEREIRALSAVFDAEIAKNPAIQEAIRERFASVDPKFSSSIAPQFSGK